MIDSIVKFPVIRYVQVCLIRVQLWLWYLRRRAGLMSFVVGYCARNKRYRKLSLSLGEVAYTRCVLACLPACLLLRLETADVCIVHEYNSGNDLVVRVRCNRFTGHRDWYWSFDLGWDRYVYFQEKPWCLYQW